MSIVFHCQSCCPSKPSLQKSAKDYLNWQQSWKETRTYQQSKSTHNTSKLCNTHAQSPKRSQHWPNNCSAMRKPKLTNKLRTTLTTNETGREKSTFALEIPTSGLTLFIQLSKLSKTNSTSNGWECLCPTTDLPTLEKSSKDVQGGNSQLA